MKNPGVLETAVNHDQQNEQFILQVVDFRTKTDGSLNLLVSDGKLKTWMVDCEKELVKDMKTASFKKSVIKVTKFKIMKGTTLRILKFEVEKEDGGEDELMAENETQIRQLKRKFYDDKIVEKGMSIDGNWIKSHPHYFSDSPTNPASKRTRRLVTATLAPPTSTSVMAPPAVPNRPGGTVECPVCGKTMKHKDSLRSHRNRVHKGQRTDDFIL